MKHKRTIVKKIGFILYIFFLFICFDYIIGIYFKIKNHNPQSKFLIEDRVEENERFLKLYEKDSDFIYFKKLPRPTNNTIDLRIEKDVNEIINDSLNFDSALNRISPLSSPRIWDYYCDPIFNEKSGFGFVAEDNEIPFRLPRWNVKGSEFLIPNQYGFRSPEITKYKKSNIFRIAFLGGSTSYSAMSELTYSRILIDSLNQWSNEKGLNIQFEEINAARNGINIHHLKAVFRREVLPFNPDLVIFYEGINHFTNSNIMSKARESILNGYDFFSQSNFETYSQFRNSINTLKLLDKIMGGRILFNFLARPKWKLNRDMLLGEGLALKDGSYIMEFESNYARGIKNLVNEVKSAGVQLALSTFVFKFPNKYNSNIYSTEFDRVYRWLEPSVLARNIDSKLLEELFLRQNIEFKKIAKKYNVPVFEIAENFPKEFNNLFIDPIHMTLLGQRIKAIITFKELIKSIETKKIKIKPSSLNSKNDEEDLFKSSTNFYYKLPCDEKELKSINKSNDFVKVNMTQDKLNKEGIIDWTQTNEINNKNVFLCLNGYSASDGSIMIDNDTLGWPKSIRRLIKKGDVDGMVIPIALKSNELVHFKGKKITVLPNASDLKIQFCGSDSTDKFKVVPISFEGNLDEK